MLNPTQWSPVSRGVFDTILMMEHLNSFHRWCHSPNLLATDKEWQIMINLIIWATNTVAALSCLYSIRTWTNWAFSSAVSLPSCTRSWHRRSTSCSSFATPSINLQWEKVHPFGPILSDILKKWLNKFLKNGRNSPSLSNITCLIWLSDHSLTGWGFWRFNYPPLLAIWDERIV